MNIKTYYYSERGLINRLIEWLQKEDANCKDKKIKFLKLLDEDFDTSGDIDIYNEFSFGEFGSPDLIIATKNKAYIIEAKIDKFRKSATSINNRFVFKDNASKINIQLLLRKRFVNSIENPSGDNDNLIHDEEDGNDGGNYKKGRQLKKPELVEWANTSLKNKEDYYYIALVSDDENDKDIFSDYFEGNPYGFDAKHFKIITWEDVDHAIERSVLEETWARTDKNRGKDNR